MHASAYLVVLSVSWLKKGTRPADGRAALSVFSLWCICVCRIHTCRYVRQAAQQQQWSNQPRKGTDHACIHPSIAASTVRVKTRSTQVASAPTPGKPASQLACIWHRHPLPILQQEQRIATSSLACTYAFMRPAQLSTASERQNLTRIIHPSR